MKRALFTHGLLGHLKTTRVSENRDQLQNNSRWFITCNKKVPVIDGCSLACWWGGWWWWRPRLSVPLSPLHAWVQTCIKSQNPRRRNLPHVHSFSLCGSRKPNTRFTRAEVTPAGAEDHDDHQAASTDRGPHPVHILIDHCLMNTELLPHWGWFTGSG